MNPGPDGVTAEFYLSFKDEPQPIILFFSFLKRRITLNLFFEACITLKTQTRKNTTKKQEYRPTYLMNIDVKFLTKIPAN